MVKPLEWTPMVPADEGQGQVDPEGKVWQELNTRQKKFVREYMKGQTATDAAMRAGYTKNRNAAKRQGSVCLLYTSPSPRDQRGSRMPSSA